MNEQTKCHCLKVSQQTAELAFTNRTHTHTHTLSSDQGTCTVILTSVLYLIAVRLHGGCKIAVEVSGGFSGNMRSQTVTPQRLELRAGKTVGERCSAAQTDSLGGSHSFAGFSIHLCCLHGDTTQDEQGKGHFLFLSTERNLHS